MASASACRQTRMTALFPEKRFSCAELVDVAWQVTPQDAHDEYGILAQIWSSGGVLLVDEPAQPGTVVTMSLPHGEVTATVQSCRREECSYALEISVAASEAWFQRGYDPHVLVLSELTRGAAKASENPAAVLLRTVARRETMLLRQLIRRPVA